MYSQCYNHLSHAVIANNFPELNLPVPTARYVPSGYWKDLNNQRKFLETLALQLGIFYSPPYANIYMD